MIGGVTIWGIIWTSGFPHLSGLPHLAGVPHLHVNRPLIALPSSFISSEQAYVSAALLEYHVTIMKAIKRRYKSLKSQLQNFINDASISNSVKTALKWTKGITSLSDEYPSNFHDFCCRPEYTKSLRLEDAVGGLELSGWSSVNDPPLGKGKWKIEIVSQKVDQFHIHACNSHFASSPFGPKKNLNPT